ncbi:MAG TPA: transketolase [Solirubrobacteraceae bacterium]|nr:transketolase [Solirubrobacteraceae bacterium]
MATDSATTTAASDVDAAVARRSIDTIRTLAMDSVQRANAGHPGTAMALAPLGYTLFRDVLRIDPAEPQWPDRDRFVLSAGHACVLQYSLLYLTGFDLGLKDLESFRQWQSRTPGHPERGHTPGIEVTTGPLGQGIGNAVGMAIAERFLAERYNRPGATLVDHHTYAICSDGDLMEGLSQESMSIAGHLRLGKLIACYDENHITIDGTTALSFDAEDHGARLKAAGWHVQRVEDSEDLAALAAALAAAREETARPSLIIVRSHIAYPAPNATDTAAAHGAPLGEEEIRATKLVLGLDPDAKFDVPGEVLEHMSLKERGAALRAEWQSRADAWREAYPDLAADWDRSQAGELLDGWQDALAAFEPGQKIATRAAGRAVMESFAPFSPTMIGGAADLVESTKTEFPGGGEFSPVHAGRNIPFGIREHAMGAIVNGLAAHGGIVKPYGSTFLMFSDYMRGAIRLSALMGLPNLWVYTHDSIGVGEDGPTHQPVEHFTSLRAIPNLWVMRPGDANEAAVCWRVALERADGPVALMLSRQGMPVLDRSDLAPAARAADGAYVLWESGAPLRLILLATGSELAPTLEAGRAIADDGIGVRVLSVPCIELLEAMGDAEREALLPRAVRARLAVEAGTRMSWWRWVGEDGDVIGVDRFGASAPGEVVMDHYGFTVANIESHARAMLDGDDAAGD